MLHVDPDQGFYKCSGCGKPGDVLTSVRETEQLGFTGRGEGLAAQAVALIGKA